MKPIEELALEAGKDGDCLDCDRAWLERFAALVRVDERVLVLEEAAKVCEQLRDDHCAATQAASDPRDRCAPGDDSCDFVASWNDAAAAIRALAGPAGEVK